MSSLTRSRISEAGWYVELDLNFCCTVLFIATILYVAVSCMHNNIIEKYIWTCASRCEHIILPSSSTTLFSVLIKQYGACLMQLSRDYAVTRRTCITLKLDISLYNKSLNPTLHISPSSSIGSALVLKSKGRWFVPAMNHYFSSNNTRLLVSRSLQVKTHNQNDWSVTNQIGYTCLRQDSYL